MMGDEVQTTQPRLDVVIVGTGAIAQVEFAPQQTVVHTERPGKEEARFQWQDPAPLRGEKR